MRKLSLGKRVTESFFTLVDEERKLWKCFCGTERVQSGSSYQNLTSHVQSKHPKEFQQLLDVCENQNSHSYSSSKNVSETRPSYFYSPEVLKVHCWLDLIVSALLPFSVVENETFRRNVKHAHIHRKSLTKHMTALTKHVESKIRRLLPMKFAIAFDGWSESSTHYVAIFAIAPSSSTLHGYESYLLGFSPFEDEKSQDAEHHMEYLEFVLEIFGKSMSNVVALLGDNCATNRKFSKNAGIALVGCASHRLNLAVKEWLKPHSDLISKLNALMKKLRTPIVAGALRTKTHLRAKCNNVTRWSSTAAMLERYQKIKVFLPELRLEAVDSLMLSYLEEREVENLNSHMSDLDSVTRALQNSEITLSQVRCLFDSVIEKFPETASYLSASSKIVQDPDFEAGIIKIQDGKERVLLNAEKTAIKPLENQCEVDFLSSTTENQQISFAERALKKRKISVNTTGYMDTRFLLPTTNIVERFFSKAGYALGSRRKNINPSNLEMQLFLNVNRNLWDFPDIKAILQ